MTTLHAGLSVHSMILVVIVAVVLAVRFALKDRHTEERRRIEAKGQEQRTSELAGKWNALRYVDAATGKLSDGFLAKLDLASLKLTQVQRTKLLPRIGELQLSFFARSSASTNAGPVYISLYWSIRIKTGRCTGCSQTCCSGRIFCFEGD